MYTHALYYLATYPEYQTLLRDEIESVFSKEGWTRSAILKLHKLDSFLKESMRLHPIGHCTFSSFLTDYKWL